MPAELREHAGRHYAIQFHYDLLDDAWALELSEAVPAPTEWTVTHLPGAPFMGALVPDESPNLEPTVHMHSHGRHVIPYEIMCWFMDEVADQVERCRAAMAHGATGSVK
ncbi:MULTISPECIES: hypothetical protein [unclassified Streptomyces]|uniref:hypothetical protein n=1 Tax=unclassified Streptomyces TaxID=2593676 RepID=UPI0035E1E5D8